MKYKIKDIIHAFITITENHTTFYLRYPARIIAILILSAYFALSQLPSENRSGHFTICIFHNITGYPCPACGTVRGLKYFFHLHFVDSIMINPLSTIVAIYMIVSLVWMSIDLAKGRASFDKITSYNPHWSVIVILIILTGINWYWNIQKGL